MTKAEPKPDEIKKQFWQYRRVQLGFVAALIILSYALPKIPLLRGWENKFTIATVDIHRSEIPKNAARMKHADDAIPLFVTENPNLKEYLKLKGPLPLAAWSCTVLGQKSLCVRYVWKNNDFLTLVATSAPKKVRRKPGPFTKSGLAGYYFVSAEKDLAFSVLGLFEPDDIYKALNFPKITPAPASNNPETAPTAIPETPAAN